MAAPDIDADQYRQDIPKISNSVPALTLYASANDEAIVLSHKLAGGLRAGDIEDGRPILVGGVEAIDVTAIGSHTLGLEDHGMFATTRPLIDDIKLVLQGIRPPDRRLAEIRGVPQGVAHPSYWRFVP